MVIYKLLPRTEWELACAAGVFCGSAVDHADGFIHFSTATQVQETARRHFRGQSDLVALLVDDGELGEALVYEPSRDGALFPHLYATLDPKLVHQVVPLQLADDGVPQLDGV